MRFFFAFIVAVFVAAPVSAAGLPGGASALNETHGDWTVHCETQAETVTCALQQRQTDRNSGQQVLAVDLRPSNDGLDGILVLPFGLALNPGLVLAVDDLTPQPRLAYRTCLPQGCLVDLAFGPETLALMRSGTVLHVETTADGGAPTPFTISLKGFAGALDRVIGLLAS